MIIGPHAVTSMFITTWLEQLYIRSTHKNRLRWLTPVIAASFASHFLLDSIPHYEYTLDLNNPSEAYKLAFDILSVFAAFFIIFWSRIKRLTTPLQYPECERAQIPPKENLFNLNFLLAIWLGIFFSCLPDVLTHISYPLTNLLLKNFKKFHDLFHTSTTVSMSTGYTIQILLYFALTFLTKFLAKKNAFEQLTQVIDEEYAMRKI